MASDTEPVSIEFETTVPCAGHVDVMLEDVNIQLKETDDFATLYDTHLEKAFTVTIDTVDAIRCGYNVALCYPKRGITIEQCPRGISQHQVEGLRRHSFKWKCHNRTELELAMQVLNVATFEDFAVSAMQFYATVLTEVVFSKATLTTMCLSKHGKDRVIFRLGNMFAFTRSGEVEPNNILWFENS